ncbi:MAG: tetratricopeptide repeat protein [Magnetococcus sp. DMHC-6]
MKRQKQSSTSNSFHLSSPQSPLLEAMEMDWWSKGIEHHQRGEFTQAEACYSRIPSSHPIYYAVLNNQGTIALHMGQLERAVELLRMALALRPDLVDALNNLGVALKKMERFEEAMSCYRQAVLLKPDYVEAQNNLGNVLKELRRFDEAAMSYQCALDVKPDHTEALNNLVALYKSQSRLDAAAAVCRRALAVSADHVDAMNNLGTVLVEQGCLGGAEALYRQALVIKPDFIDVLNNLAAVLGDLGRLDEAEESYRRVLALQPDFTKSLSNLLFTQNYRGDQNMGAALEDAKRFGALVAAKATPFFHKAHPEDGCRRLRVGLVSGDFFKHPVGYFLEGVVTAIDPQAVELYAFANHTEEDDLTQRLKAVIPHWRIVKDFSDEKLAHLIRSEGVDILVDLAGHSARNRLSMFAWKPAPVQVAWLGYFATTGVGGIDYILGDAINLPPEDVGHFTETPWHLPDCYLCFTPPDIAISVAPLPALSTGYVTFGCFNNTTKMTPAVVTCWTEILNRIPNSRLFLKSKNLADPVMRQTVLDRFSQAGLDVERLILEGPDRRENYLASYHRVDISLDPFPFPGGTTSVEGLWMGVPVLTKRGHRFISHQGETILSHGGLSDWIARDGDDYVAKAVAFANDLPKLAALRARLRAQVLRSPLFDAKKFAQNLVAAWQGMWHKWCTGEMFPSSGESEIEALVKISIIVCSIHVDRLERFKKSVAFCLAPEWVEWIVISDAKSLAEGYNRGIRASRGEILLLCHEDIEFICADFMEKLERGLARFDMVGVAGASEVVGPGPWWRIGSPYIHSVVIYPAIVYADMNRLSLQETEKNRYFLIYCGDPHQEMVRVKVLDGLFLAGRRSMFQTLAFDEIRFDGFHFYDLDISLAAHLAGYKVGVCKDIFLIHHSAGSISREWHLYREKFIEKYHGRIPFFPEKENMDCAAKPVGEREDLSSLLCSLTLSSWIDQNSQVARTPLYFLELALNSYQQNRFVEAAQQCQQALELDVTRVDGWTLRGMIYNRVGAYTQALEAYNRAIQLNPDYAEVHYNLGNLLGSLGQREGSLLSYQRALYLQPGNAEFQRAIAHALSHPGSSSPEFSTTESPSLLVWQTLTQGPATLLPPHHGINVSLLTMADPPCGLVLDVGCGTGRNGEWLKQRFAGIQVMGIEMNQAAALQAAMRLDRVWCASLEDVDLQSDGVAYGTIGLLVLGDILEHLYNPWEMLLRLRPFLHPEAQILASIPNSRNLTVWHPLVEKGVWSYDVQGLLDITHIRFFTAESIRQLFNETGYLIEKMVCHMDSRLQELYRQKQESLRAGHPIQIQVGRLTLDNISEEELKEFCTIQFFVQAKMRLSQTPLF